ncbi:MAG TPA: hypothetical protein VGY57_08140, partial [Vicinamibacterales bacterium]|nr:hypothetical protein [Vicinamibacterales bacterium]
VIAAIVSASRRRPPVRMLLAVAAAFLLSSAAATLNAFPSRMAAFSTAQPLPLQLAVLLGASGVAVTLLAIAMAIIAAVVPGWSAPGAIRDRRTALVLALAVGAIGAASRLAGAIAGAQRDPSWPSYAGAGTYVPFLAASLAPIAASLSRIVVILLIVAAANRMTTFWTRRRALAGVLLFVIAGLLGASAPAQGVGAWIVSATAAGGLFVAAYLLVLRHDLSLVPIAVAAMTVIGAVREGAMQAYGGALPGSMVGALAVAAIGYVWFAALREPGPAVSTAAV